MKDSEYDCTSCRNFPCRCEPWLLIGDIVQCAEKRMAGVVTTGCIGKYHVQWSDGTASKAKQFDNTAFDAPIIKKVGVSTILNLLTWNMQE